MDWLHVHDELKDINERFLRPGLASSLDNLKALRAINRELMGNSSGCWAHFYTVKAWGEGLGLVWYDGPTELKDLGVPYQVVSLLDEVIHFVGNQEIFLLLQGLPGRVHSNHPHLPCGHPNSHSMRIPPPFSPSLRVVRTECRVCSKFTGMELARLVVTSDEPQQVRVHDKRRVVQSSRG